MSVRLLLSQNNGDPQPRAWHFHGGDHKTGGASRLIEGINKKIAEEGENHE